jgi:DNA-directed RNA polymerase subunit RPC12/RpoP
MTEPVTMYVCLACGKRKKIPGQAPLQPEPRISVGCPNCERIQTHKPQGVR